MEEWKDIEGYEHKYQVSNIGRVKNKASKRILVLCSDGRGYLTVSLSGKTTAVHRLVAKAFIPNLKNKRECNHIDGCKSNNNVKNLEWVTTSENRLHAFRLGLQKHTEQSKIKISESLKGHPVSDETKEKIRRANIGKRHSEETKQKLSEINSGEKSQFYGKHPWIFGLHHSEETKRKISESNKGKHSNPERNRKISEAKTKWWAEKKLRDLL